LSLKILNPLTVFPPYRGYAHAIEVGPGSRMLFISGLNGFDKDGISMPESFEGQAEMIWKHIKAILAEAEMAVSDLVSLRTYLASSEYDEQNAAMREKHLGGNRVASTVIVCQLLETKWKLEVEAVAAK